MANDSGTTLGNVLIDGRRQLDAGEAEWLLRLAEFHRNGDWVIDGARDTRHWMRFFLRMSGPTAKEKLRVALALQQQPRYAQALAEGRVSFCQIRAITRYRGGDPDVEAALLQAAELGNTVADLERAVRYAAQLSEQDRDPDGLADWERVGLRVRTQYDGLETIEITVPPDMSGRLLAMLDARLDHLFFNRPVDSHESTGTEPVTLAERRLHALFDILDAGVVKLDERGEIDLERAVLNVMVDYDRLFRDANHGASETSGGVPLTGSALHELMCNAGYQRIIVKGKSIILDMGRKTREWTPQQRRAIRARFGHRCAIPACHNHITHIHHTHPWGQGGETNLDAGIPLCGFHHRLVHTRGWWITMHIEDGYALLHAPDGRTFSAPTHTYNHFEGGLAT